jgi:hypothetical protein
MAGRSPESLDSLAHVATTDSPVRSMEKRIAFLRTCLVTELGESRSQAAAELRCMIHARDATRKQNLASDESLAHLHLT